LTDYDSLKRNFYGFDERIARAKKRIAEDPALLPENRLVVLAFLKRKEAEGVSPARIAKYCYLASTIAKLARKPLKEMNASDVETLLLAVDSSKNYKPNTRRDFRITVKALFKMIRGVPNSPEVAWISARRVLIYKSPENNLTEEEVQKMVDACRNDRDRALISTLYYSNARIGELLTLSSDRVIDKGNRFVLQVAGKTGAHDIPLVEGFEPLRRLLANHSLKNERVFPVFVNERSQPMKYYAARKILIVAASRAGIMKKVNPHKFRDSRSTELAAHNVGESVLNALSGRVQGSEMARVYVNLASKQIEDAMLEVANKKKADKAQGDDLFYELIEEYLRSEEGLNQFIKGLKSWFKQNKQAVTPILQRIVLVGNLNSGKQAPGVKLTLSNKSVSRAEIPRKRH